MTFLEGFWDERLADPEARGRARGGRGRCRRSLRGSRSSARSSSRPPRRRSGSSWWIRPRPFAGWASPRRLDPGAGGRYRVEVLPGKVVLGEFIELDPPRRLVHTWGWASGSGSVPPGSTTVAFDLVSRDDGTLLSVTHGELSRGRRGLARSRLGPLPPTTRGDRDARRRPRWPRPMDRAEPDAVSDHNSVQGDK